MIVAFTGPSKLTKDQELRVVEELGLVNPKYTVWRSGCAFGVDTIVADESDTEIRKLELYVPHAPCNEELVDQFKDYANVKVIWCGDGAKGAYRIRNEAMIQGANLLIAFLKSPNFYRSGEWMTVNIADRLGVPVDQVIFS